MHVRRKRVGTKREKSISSESGELDFESKDMKIRAKTVKLLRERLEAVKEEEFESYSDGSGACFNPED